MAKIDMPKEVREFFADARRQAWKGVPKKKRKTLASKAASTYWDKKTPEERSAEMKRRAAKREANRKKAADAKAP